MKNNRATKIKVWSRVLFQLAKNPLKLKVYLDDFNFLSDRETILFLKRNRVGFVRYGNSEISFSAGYSIRHQKHNKVLEKKIRNILLNYKKEPTQNNYLVALPLDLVFKKNLKERKAAKNIWRGAPRYGLFPFLKKDHTYGSPFCFRLANVIDNNIDDYKKLALSLFGDKKIIYVGPYQNFEGIISPVRFIQIPPKNVFENYQNLLEKIIEEAKNIENHLVLITAGITSTALSAELNDKGILTYDIGQIFRFFK